MKSPSIYLATALVFAAGLLVGQVSGQEPVRIEKPDLVQVLPDQNIQEFTDLLSKHWNPPEVKDALLEEMWRKIEGDARAGQHVAGLIVMRVKAAQAAAKK